MAFKKKEKKYKITTEVETAEKEKQLPNPLLGTKFWFFCIGTAILLVLGIWILLDHSLGTKLAIATTGAIVFLFAIFRVVPLFKGTKNNKTKLSITIEILIDILIGIFLFYVAFAQAKDGDTKLSEFVNKNYKYFLGFVLYAKAVFYFINTSLLSENTSKFEFWIHIAVITASVTIFALDFDANKLGIVVAILCLLSSLVIGITAGGSYMKYHKAVIKPKKAEKKQQEEAKTDVILPDNNDKQDEIVI